MDSRKLTSIVKEMTLDEKIAQLLQLAAPFFKGAKNEGQITGPLASMKISDENIKDAGSVLGASGASEVINIQRAHLENNRLGIPLLFMADVIHGYKTIFPIPLAIGCSWDLQKAQHSAEIAAKEAAAAGVHVTFAPMADLVRDPRWGRVMESTGEDPFLNSEFARAFVRGFQGNDLANDKQTVAACVKHFAAYGAPEGGRDYNTVNMSERQLREAYLPAYKAALDEGCEMVMTAFNTVDGIPATGNSKLMRDLLRNEWKFDGVLISDWGAVKELIPHGVAEDEKEAALKAISAGVDIEMMTSCYVDHLKELVAAGKVDEGLIDEAALRVLTLKNKLGLFENPYRGADEGLEEKVVLSEEHRRAARELAVKSSVLLKNDGVLPLKKDRKISLIGPFAQNGDILGPWSWLGSREKAVQLYDGIKAKLAPSLLTTAQGCDIETGSEEQMAEAIKAAEGADVIVLALGEASEMSGEAGCRADIRLPEIQLKLAAKLRKLGKPIVTVLFNGRPLDLHGIWDEADAILEAWYPGTEGGHAIADLLFGDANPSGKLTMSFPFSVGQVPVYYNHFNTGRPKEALEAEERYVSQYLDIPNDPLLPFGFGLSYTAFTYRNAGLSAGFLSPSTPITLSVEIENAGSLAGEEIVQFYIQDISGEVVRPVKELKGFKSVILEPGEKTVVTFEITEELLRYHHSDLTFKSDEGKFMAYVGTNSKDNLGLPFELVID